MDSCIANSHRVEYIEDYQGITWYRCMTCGEAYPVYRDTNGG